MEKIDPKEKIIETCRSISEKKHVSIEDQDSLRLLTERCQNEFSNTASDILKTLINESLVYDRDQEFALKAANRFLRVVELESQLGTSSELSSADNLIPKFELEKADKVRVFELCNAMRKIVLASQVFDEPHRIRLLNRIAAIEVETHKPKGMFDVVRGGVNDLGETLGKFGADIKPLTDRMQEVVGIARKGSKQYDQLPPPEEIKQLPAPGDEGE